MLFRNLKYKLFHFHFYFWNCNKSLSERVESSDRERMIERHTQIGVRINFYSRKISIQIFKNRHGACVSIWYWINCCCTKITRFTLPIRYTTEQICRLYSVYKMVFTNYIPHMSYPLSKLNYFWVRCVREMISPETLIPLLCFVNLPKIFCV